MIIGLGNYCQFKSGLYFIEASQKKFMILIVRLTRQTRTELLRVDHTLLND
jgi:hypothetical protein